MPTPSSHLLLETLLVGANDAGHLADAWRGADVAGLADLVQYEGCSLWLHQRLVDLGLLDSVDQEFAETLSWRSRQLVARNLAVDAERRDVVAVLHDAGVPFRLLKGAALRLMGPTLPYVQSRTSWDVDVLVPEQYGELAWEAMEARGYTRATKWASRFQEHHHYPPLVGNRRVCVELHTSISRDVPAELAWEWMYAAGQVVQDGSHEVNLPAYTALLWHAAIHAISEPRYAFRLRYFQDAIALSSVREQIQWQVIAERTARPEVRDADLVRQWINTALHMCGERPLFPNARIFDVARALRWRHLVLRTLDRPDQSGSVKISSRTLMSRARRLLIDEGTGMELHRSLPPLHVIERPIAKALRGLAAIPVRLGYRVWSSLQRSQKPRAVVS